MELLFDSKNGISNINYLFLGIFRVFLNLAIRGFSLLKLICIRKCS